MRSFQSISSRSCGTRVRLQRGGTIQCDKPAVFVEMSHPQRERIFRVFMCSDHMRRWQEGGYVIQVLKDEDVPGKWSAIREKKAQGTCTICNRLFGEHSQKEFDDHFAQLAAPTVRLYPKGRRAKKEDVWFSKCEICGRRFLAHTQQEYDACINQFMNRRKPKQEELVYVKCEICGCLFRDHSPEKFDACLDQLIENSV